MQARERQLRLGVDAHSPEDQDPESVGDPSRRGEQSGLADAGLACDQHCSPTVAELLDEIPETPGLVLTPEQRNHALRGRHRMIIAVS
jgi:hypothetical protein